MITFECRTCGAEGAEAIYDARGIYVGRFCDEKCAIEAGYRAEIFTDSRYEADEPIEADY